MFGRSIELFELFGFKVKLDISWVILALLISWSLAQGFFPTLYEGLPAVTYWWMGITGMIGLFISIVLHELSHSLVARRYDLPIEGITLFIFGGVAEMTAEPKQPKAEFLMAIAGPAASVVLAGVFGLIAYAGTVMGWAQPFTAVMDYLALLNIILAVFNMIPAFPLDGGRILRAGLWYWKGDIHKATRIAARSGTIFGLTLVALGVISLLYGNIVGGLWWILIGLFLRGAAGSSYTQQMVRQSLENRPVRDVMSTEPVAAPADLTVRRFVDDYVYRYGYDVFPLTEDAKLVGCVRTRDIRELPREQWQDKSIYELCTPCDENNTIGADTDAQEALNIMRRSGNTRLMVTQNGELKGILALKDLMTRLSLREELEGG